MKISSTPGSCGLRIPRLTFSHTHIHKPTDSFHWYKSSSRRHSQEDFSRLVWMSGRLQQYIFSPLISYTNQRLSLFKLHLFFFFKSVSFFSFTSHLLTLPSLSALLVWYNRRVLLHTTLVLSGREQERLVFLQCKLTRWWHHPNKFTSNYSFSKHSHMRFYQANPTPINSHVSTLHVFFFFFQLIDCLKQRRENGKPAF